MMCRVSVSLVAACVIIILQIWPVIALTWKNVSTQIISCEDEEVHLKWEYELNPMEYVGAKSWSSGKNEKAIRIAYWKDTQGLTLEQNFNDRVKIIGNDSLLIRNITTKDGGTYTLTVFLPRSSEQNPKCTLNLTVLKPPLEACCKPTIHQLANGTGLRASLNTQACGTEPFELKWKNAPETKANGDVLLFDTTEVTGTFTVCVTGLAVEKCFKGNSESLCQKEYIEKTSEIPKTKEQHFTLIPVLSSVGTLIVLAVIVVLIIALNWRRMKKYRKRNRNWKAVRASFKFENDDRMFRYLILTEDEKMDKATMEISNIMYFVYNNSKELAIEKINTANIALENSEIMYFDNYSDDDADGILMATHQTKVSNPSYAECLYHKEKPLKLLILQGELGIGKTKWCRKFVKTWCEAHEGQYHGISIQKESENIQTLKLFPLLFFVSLRNVDKKQTLKEVIKEQCMIGKDTQTGHFDDNLDLLMEQRPDKLIFIIHGVDEADADVDILNEIVAQTRNSLTILTCREWEPLQSKYMIQEKNYQPMAYITLKQIDTRNVQLYASRIFDDYGYPKDAVSEFMELVRRNQMKQFMEEAYFVQPLIQIWHKSGMLPSDATDVCLCLIENNLKEKKQQLMEYTTLNLDLDVDLFVPKARGKIFVIRFGKLLCSLGKIALQTKGSKNIFYENDLMGCANIPVKQLTEICIAAKLVSTAPVSDSGRENKRLCFQHSMIQRFLVAFYLACEGESQVKDTQREESTIIQTFLTSLTLVSETVPCTT